MIEVVAIGAFWGAVVYAVTAFIEWDIHAQNWPLPVRLAAAVVWFCLTLWTLVGETKDH
jgi:hypothetical protein